MLSLSFALSSSMRRNIGPGIRSADPGSCTLAEVGSKQGEVVGGKGGKEPVANMGILHGCHWLTPAIARGCSTTWTYKSTLADMRVRPAGGAVSILNFEMRGSALEDTRSVGP